LSAAVVEILAGEMQRHCRIARQVPRLLKVCLGRNTYCHHGEFDDPIEKSWAKEIEISEERDEIQEIQHGAHKEDMMKHATGRYGLFAQRNYEHMSIINFTRDREPYLFLSESKKCISILAFAHVHKSIRLGRCP
jgi:hypothetical protein